MKIMKKDEVEGETSMKNEFQESGRKVMGSHKLGNTRVVVDLRYGKLTSELISLSVGSELTFYAVLDSFSARGHGKNCPVKIFEVYVEILGVLYFGRICRRPGGLRN